MHHEQVHATLVGRSLLIVEDDAVLAALLGELFGDLGCSVSPAVTNAAALAILAAQGVDVALVDVTLRNETSYAVVERLIELDVPFVFATGQTVLPAHNRAAAVLLKPYRPADATRAVAVALVGHSQRAHRAAMLAAAASNAIG